MPVVERLDGQMLNLGAAREIYADPGDDRFIIAEYSGNMIYKVKITIDAYRRHIIDGANYIKAAWNWESDRW